MFDSVKFRFIILNMIYVKNIRVVEMESESRSRGVSAGFGIVKNERLQQFFLNCKIYHISIT